MDYLPQILLMVCLVACSAYFSATETAFSTLNKTRMKAIAEKGSKKAALVLALSERYDQLISTILVGNNIVNIALASVGTMLFIDVMHNDDLAATVSTGVITVVVLIFGEISPKSLAKDSPERFAMVSAPILRVLLWLLMPVNFLFTQWKKLLSCLIKVQDNTKISQEELLLFVEEVEQEGALEKDEGDLIRSAIEFTGQKAEDILTHRVDLEAVALDTPKEEIAQVFLESRFSRLPVYEQSIDKIEGILHLKDFFTVEGITAKPLEEIMTKPLYIQKSVMVDDLLRLFQQNKSHLAVVVDEYGGTLGIVTMEDVIEELVGEIWDEHDEVVEEFYQIEDNTYQVDCLTDFEDFCQFFHVQDETDSRSVGGWVMEKLDKIPQQGDAFEHENLWVTITHTDAHRAMYIQVVVQEKQPTEKRV